MGWRVGVDLVSEAVDDDVVVEPAQGGEVVRVMITAGGSGPDVVDLEAVPGVATGNSAAPVAVFDETAHLRGYRPGPIRSDDGFPVL